MYTLTVLRGNDPVLKLRDNRIQGFFCLACRWKPDTTPFDGNTAPPEMRTGMSALASGDFTSLRHGIKLANEIFVTAAKKEVSLL